jgi:hypothetical protein
MEEREKVQKRVQKATPDSEVPDVEGHKVQKLDDSPTVERERVIRADEDDDGPDVEAHRIQK